MSNKQNIFAKRRAAFAASMVKNSFAVFTTNAFLPAQLGDKFNMGQNAEYYYLTGLEYEIGCLIIAKSGAGIVDETLYLADVNPDLERWDGKMLNHPDAKEISGIMNIQSLSIINQSLNSLAVRLETVYAMTSRSSLGYGTSFYENLINEVCKNFPHLTRKSANTNLLEQRWVKDSTEVAAIKEAIEVTHQGILNIAKYIKPKCFENQIDGAITFEYYSRGAKHAFHPIVGAGLNSTVLHYTANNQVLKAGSVLLLDTGARKSMYNADITRTFPIGGKFSSFAEEIYSINLEVQKAVIKFLKPGLTFRQVFAETSEIQANLLFKHKLIKNKADFKKYTVHNLGHPLGLDVHDPMDKDRKLEAGSVVTVEPGLYFNDKEIGIRIEDDVLITKTGAENLSAKIPKELKEIYKLLNV